MTALGGAMAMGTLARTLSSLVEAMPILKTAGFNQLIGFLADMASFGRISSNTIGKLYDVALGDQVEAYIRERIRSKMPDLQQVHGWYAQGELTYDEWAQYMSWFGYKNSDFSHLRRTPGDGRVTSRCR